MQTDVGNAVDAPTLTSAIVDQCLSGWLAYNGLHTGEQRAAVYLRRLWSALCFVQRFIRTHTAMSSRTFRVVWQFLQPMLVRNNVSEPCAALQRSTQVQIAEIDFPTLSESTPLREYIKSIHAVEADSDTLVAFLREHGWPEEQPVPIVVAEGPVTRHLTDIGLGPMTWWHTLGASVLLP